MVGSVLQISVSKGGVPKRAVESGLVTPLGLEGDSHANPQIHGGPRQALLVVTSEGVDELNLTGFALFPGALGENITTRGIDRRSWRVGQRWSIGSDVLIEITKRRSPCQTLNVYGSHIQTAIFDAMANAGDPESPKWGLSGFYAAVIQSGAIRPGDEIRLA